MQNYQVGYNYATESLQVEGNLALLFSTEYFPLKPEEPKIFV